jgi:hypothetical protein
MNSLQPFSMQDKQNGMLRGCLRSLNPEGNNQAKMSGAIMGRQNLPSTGTHAKPWG